MKTAKHAVNSSSGIQMDALDSLMGRVMEQSSEGVVVTDANLELPGPKIIYVNRAACRISGYSVDELLGKTPRIFQGPKTDRKVLDKLKSTLSAGDVFKGKTTNYRKDGSEYVVEWSVSPIRDSAGEITHFVSTQNDVSTEVRYLEKIKEKSEKLEEALLQANLANEAKSQFLMMMSHELRTPLNPIMGLAEMLAEETSDPDLRASLELIVSSAEHLTGLIGDILDLSSIEPGNVKLTLKPLPLAQKLKEIFESFRPRAEAKGLQFTFIDHGQLETDPCLVCMGDERKIQQAVANLLSNAIKFSREGQVRMELMPPVLSAGEASISIQVIDRGIGIEPGKYEAIFDPFYQVDMGATRDYGGQGLGLHLSREIARAMGGTIAVSSQPGEGSEFELSLKLEVAPPGDSAQGGATLVSEKPYEELQVLVAEDELSNRFVISKMLKALGVSHDMVEDGTEALKALAEKNYDLVLMDIQMPGMNGVDTTRQIRSGGYGESNIPIVALSAHVNEEVKTEASEAGMNVFLEKPLTPPKLKDCLKDILALGRF